ncbi:hypothetical protein AaE_014523 [Aphanomyces astaci]|uniref:DDE Tnp4 domain-containing protein n=1 Tax=Aphanomyces astaci TaxID=112090 RepID=A0A6A4ZD76_APHAT|nr:hypothetical protein AaE_014523 [Aphanomyces astaci]
MKHDVAHRVAMALFYLCDVDGIAYTTQVFRICRTLAKSFTTHVIKTLVHFCFATTVMLPTTEAVWQTNKDEIEVIAGFPDVCCAVDGTLIRIKRFADDEDYR